MKKESSGATLMKTMISGAGAMFMKRRAPQPELCHFFPQLHSPEIIHSVTGHIDEPE